MKTSLIVFVALLLAGCAGSRHGAALTAEQARLLSLRLANDKAMTIYRCQPFHSDLLPQFIAGHWVWTEQEGYGHSDLQVTVELSADGFKHNVEVRLMDSRETLSRIVFP